MKNTSITLSNSELEQINGGDLGEDVVKAWGYVVGALTAIALNTGASQRGYEGRFGWTVAF